MKNGLPKQSTRWGSCKEWFSKNDFLHHSRHMTPSQGALLQTSKTAAQDASQRDGCFRRLLPKQALIGCARIILGTKKKAGRCYCHIHATWVHRKRLKTGGRSYCHIHGTWVPQEVTQVWPIHPRVTRLLRKHVTEDHVTKRTISSMGYQWVWPRSQRLG